jgi:hypothetical protein
MAFDQETRNRLASLVGAARAKLVQEFTRQLQSDYGLDPATGAAADLDTLRHLDDSGRETARILRETWHHYLAGAARQDARAQRDALDRIVREQAFTVLNRLCALRMAEARGLLIESVGQGHDSRGFALYRHVAGSALGETGDAYRVYLFSVFDELAIDLPALFDRYSPQGRLFPRDVVLREVLGLINAPQLEPLWAEDETIGWIYQYFNSKEERQQMRAESAAPRNSRELAVRNQFFTPRYVVEFLTDNTLGRIWYEMTRGETALVDACAYLVRRPLEIFLRGDEHHLVEEVGDWVGQVMAGDWEAIADEPTERELAAVALLIDGYAEAPRVGIDDLLAWAGERVRAFQDTGVLPAAALDLWLLLFALQRHWRIIIGSGPAGEEFLSLWRRVYHELRAALLASQPDATQAELLRQAVFIGHRPLKDPRDIKLLDPACGSMHFGLYAFDLLERIYDEAWAIEEIQGSRALARPDGLAPLTEQYADYDAFRRDIPRLILAHNLHGIDIDPRAVQIAGLSLWLRAQRSWREQGVAAADRPSVRRANVVCAEPMPGEREMLGEFVRGLHPAVGELVVKVFDEMKLAGEAGSLLKIEVTLRETIEAARARCNDELLRHRQDAGYLPGLAPARATTLLDLMDLPDPDAFWGTLEEQVLAALAEYATHIESNGASYRRRLFADDAARGFAFIDLCRQRYDVVVMNPPFGEAVPSTKEYIRTNYPNAYNDVYAAFTEGHFGKLHQGAKLGAVTSRSGFFLTTFRRWRESFIQQHANIDCLVDLGLDVMDEAMVEAAAYCISAGPRTISSPYFRLLSALDKAQQLQTLVSRVQASIPSNNTKWASQATYSILPQSPLVYWVESSIVRKLLAKRKWSPEKVEIRQGLATADDFRFARGIWEIPSGNLRSPRIPKGDWVPYIKGGSSLPWFAPVTLVVNWARDAAELWNNRSRQGKIRSNIWMLQDAIDRYFFQPGFSWTRRAVRFIPYVTPSGAIPSASRYLAYPSSSSAPYIVLGIAASNTASSYLRFYGERFNHPNYMVEVVKTMLWPDLDENTQEDLKAFVQKQVNSRRALFQGSEPYHEFLTPTICNPSLESGDTSFDPKSLLGDALESRVAQGFGLTESEYHSLIKDLQEAVSFQAGSLDEDNSEVDTENSLLDIDSGYAELLSYLVGVTFGRWDIRYATGQRAAPELPDPFAPLPACPPGMLQNAAGLPAAPEDVPSDYPLRVSWPGVLVVDEGHPEDIVSRVREALAVVWPDTHDAIEGEACAILGVPSLRDYFARPDRFFADHLSRYRKSRRVAPIYWPLSSPGGQATVWLYYHRLTDQTLYSVVNDFVDPRLKRAADDAARLRTRAGRSRADERELERLVDLEDDLRTFREELLRVAEFWRPNLNDGVQITAAPFWRLFRHRPWQKRLRETWEKLAAGDYDWAHLAYAIWPERVREKCRTDKSLAIAHDLEHLYVAPPDAPQKKRRAKATESAEEDAADVD